MRSKTARVNRVNPWPRYAGAVAAAFWVLGIAAGCHLPHAAGWNPHTSPMSAAVAGHDVAVLAHHTPPGADCCSPLNQACKHVAQACSTTDPVALVVVVAVVAFAVSSAWPAVSVPRGPPPPAGFIPYRSGRIILTQLCIARI